MRSRRRRTDRWPDRRAARAFAPKSVPAPSAARGTPACREGSSSRETAQDGLGKGRVEVVGDLEPAAVAAKDAAASPAPDGNQAHDRLARLGDDHLLALGGALDQLGEVRLRLMNIDLHSAIIV